MCDDDEEEKNVEIPEKLEEKVQESLSNTEKFRNVLASMGEGCYLNASLTFSFGQFVEKGSKKDKTIDFELNYEEGLLTRVVRCSNSEVDGMIEFNMCLSKENAKDGNKLFKLYYTVYHKRDTGEVMEMHFDWLQVKMDKRLPSVNYDRPNESRKPEFGGMIVYDRDEESRELIVSGLKQEGKKLIKHPKCSKAVMVLQILEDERNENWSSGENRVVRLDNPGDKVMGIRIPPDQPDFITNLWGKQFGKGVEVEGKLPLALKLLQRPEI